MTPRKIVAEDSFHFCRSIIAQGSLLHEAIDWIQNNLHPEDVFPDEQLHLWAKEIGYEYIVD